jgi:hypothetical protein
MNGFLCSPTGKSKIGPIRSSCRYSTRHYMFFLSPRLLRPVTTYAVLLPASSTQYCLKVSRDSTFDLSLREGMEQFVNNKRRFAQGTSPSPRSNSVRLRPLTPSITRLFAHPGVVPMFGHKQVVTILTLRVFRLYQAGFVSIFISFLT